MRGVRFSQRAPGLGWCLEARCCCAEGPSCLIWLRCGPLRGLHGPRCLRSTKGFKVLMRMSHGTHCCIPGTPRRFSRLAADPHHIIALEMPSWCRLSGLKASLHSCLGTLARLSLRSSAGPHRLSTVPLHRRNRFSTSHGPDQPWSPAVEVSEDAVAVANQPQACVGAASRPASCHGMPTDTVGSSSDSCC
jgi:hypothetical protein